MEIAGGFCPLEGEKPGVSGCPTSQPVSLAAPQSLLSLDNKRGQVSSCALDTFCAGVDLLQGSTFSQSKTVTASPSVLSLHDKCCQGLQQSLWTFPPLVIPQEHPEASLQLAVRGGWCCRGHAVRALPKDFRIAFVPLLHLFPVCSRNRFVKRPLGKAVSSRKQL